MARMTNGKVVNFFQERGARIHFNHTEIDSCVVPSLHDKCKTVNIRYGIIELDSVQRDLKLWETLMVSSMMQRPHSVLVPNGGYTAEC
jgi:hypothetical protein